MEGKKSFFMYFLVFLFIGFIIVFFVLPSNGEVLLECSFSKSMENVTTMYNIKSKYINGKFYEVDNEMIVDLSKKWVQRRDYQYSLEQDGKIYVDAGFKYEVSVDNKNKFVIAKMHADKDTLNNEFIYFAKLKEVRNHFEKDGYVCKEEKVK